MELSPKQAHCLEKILKAINKWRVAGQNNQENSKKAQLLGKKAMQLITENLELLTGCLDKYGGSLKTKNALNQHLAMVEGMRINNDLSFENMGGYYDYQLFAQDYFSSDIETWIKELRVNHSPDFQSVTWYGGQYTFNKSQAVAIKLLWGAWEKGIGVPQKTIAEAVDSYATNFRLLDLFRIHGNYHPAWHKMIKHTGGDIYTLSTPKD